MKKFLGILLVVSVGLAVPASPASAEDLTLTIKDGRVTLIAQNVPLSRILAEWARVGQATVLNGEKLSGPPLTLHFENQPEREVLDILLRNASGYIVAPRAVAMADASVFDRILIMPTSRPPAVSAVAAPPQFNRPPAPPVPIQPDMGDERPVEPVPGMVPQNQMQNPNAPMTQPVPGMPMPGQPQFPMTQPRPGMPTAPPGGVQPNPDGTQPLPPGVRPPGVRPPGGGEGL